MSNHEKDEVALAALEFFETTGTMSDFTGSERGAELVEKYGETPVGNIVRGLADSGLLLGVGQTHARRYKTTELGQQRAAQLRGE